MSKIGPYEVEVEAGKTYHWCACGQSKNQPFCDSSHVATGFNPVAFTPDKSGRVYLCGCKRTNTEPFCDSSHNEL